MQKTKLPEQKPGTNRHPPEVDSEGLRRELENSISGEIYATDASNYRMEPIGVSLFTIYCLLFTVSYLSPASLVALCAARPDGT